MGSPSAPKPDPRIGEAALRTAEIGEDYLAFMKSQSEITNGWASEDRARYQDTFEPLQDRFIQEATGYDTPRRRGAAEAEATADVQLSLGQARDASERRMSAMGVMPGSGRYLANKRRENTSGALAQAGAREMARRRVEDTGRSLQAAAVNMGAGFAVNPATSMGLTNSAMGSGAAQAMSANQSAGAMLGGADQMKMNAWQTNQNNLAGFAGALGQLGGMAWMASSKDYKEDKKPAPGVLDALKKMPVEEWTYKKGHGDEGRHIGPYAEDFQAATGLGDGKTIGIIDALGVNMGAVKELDAKVDKLAKKLS